MITPKQFQEKHNRRLKGAIQDMRTGIENVTEAPTLKAAAKSQKMLQNLTASIQSGKWADGLKAVSLDDWKSKMIDKGLNRISDGIDSAAAKVEGFAAKLLPYVEGVQRKIKAMPDMTIEDNINRMVTNVREMSKFKK